MHEIVLVVGTFCGTVVIMTVISTLFWSNFVRQMKKEMLDEVKLEVQEELKKVRRHTVEARPWPTQPQLKTHHPDVVLTARSVNGYNGDH